MSVLPQSEKRGDAGPVPGRVLAALAIFVVVFGAGVAPAFAQAQQKLIKQCLSGIPDQMISGCSKLINMRGFSISDRSSMFNNRGIAWAAKEETDKALADYDEAIRLAPQYKYYHNRGQALSTQKGDQDKAIADYNEALKLDPTQSHAYMDRGIAWERKGDKDRAMADYDEAIRHDPKYAPAYENRGLLWRKLGEYDRALTDLNTAVRLDAKNPHPYASRATIWQLKGDLEHALADANEAIKRDPKAALYLCYRGEIHRYRGALTDSISDYDAALRNVPDFAFAYTGRGLTYEKQGDQVRARADFEKALTITKFYDSNATAQETARAQLAALDAGAPHLSPSVTPSPEQSASAATPQAISAQGRRVALVIGNSAYKNAPTLPNPERDAAAIAKALQDIGFETVTLDNNATREQFVDALRVFAEESEKSDWAVVYYAGHGIEVAGLNYLIPIDARLATDRDVEFEAVSLGQVLTSVEGAKKLKLVILDACRDNPFVPQMRHTSSGEAVASAQTGGTSFGTRSIGRGLAQVKPQGATLVVFAAKDGQVALDGEGNNSPFAVAMLQRIATPGVEISKLIRLVRDDVMEATAGRQEPFTYGSLPGREDFFFVAK